MRHLLLVSHFFPPMGGGGVQRVTKFVKYLEQYGWRTTVVAGRPEDYWMRDATLADEIPASARVLHIGGASGLGLWNRVRRGAGGTSRRSSRGFGLLRRLSSWMLLPDSYIGWRPFALAAARQVLRQDAVDAVLSSGPPETNHLIALALKREARCPWVADFRDPWVGLHLIPAPTAWHRAGQARLEHAVLTESDALVATTHWLGDLLRARGAAPATPIEVIRNGFDPTDFAPGPERPAAANGPLMLLHAGMLTLTRSAAGLLEGTRLLLERRPEWRTRLCIELLGARESRNDALVAELGLSDCVVLLDYVPHREAIARMQAADVLVLIKHTAARYRGLIPGKLYEYLGAQRPLLALVPESEAAELVRSLGCGEVAPPDDAAAIAAALERLVEAKLAGRLQASYACQPPASLQRPEQARQLAGLLDRVTRAGVRA